MEQYNGIKNNNLSDITYMSELIPTVPSGLIHTITYSHFRVRKLCVH